MMTLLSFWTFSARDHMRVERGPVVCYMSQHPEIYRYEVIPYLCQLYAPETRH